MKSRPAWEVLVGDYETLDYLASISPAQDERDENPLQATIEEILEEELTEHEREVYHLRFGEQLSFREIAEVMGYDSHQPFQYHVDKIMKKVKDALERRASSDDEGHN